MDEYIKREDVISAICMGCNEEFSEEPCEPDCCAIRRAIKNIATDDVVPKSEVEKLQNELVIWKQNRFNLYQKLECYEMARQKVARDIFEEIEKYKRLPLPECKPVYILKDGEFSALKKKYTEAEAEPPKGV